MADQPTPAKTLAQFIDELIGSLGGRFEEARLEAVKKAIDSQLESFPAQIRKSLALVETIGGPKAVIHLLRKTIAVYQAELDSRLYD